jgi:hypothetical protein
MSDLAWWLKHFQRSAFRLETLPAYSMPQEADMLAAFCRGQEVKLPEDHPWPQLVRGATQTGRTMQRVRVVSHPLTDYLRFELSLFPRSVEAGEDVRVAVLDDHPELQVCEHDFWSFDDQVVVVLEYDNTGRFLGTRIEQDLIHYRQLRELALSCSMELSAYTTRAARR